MAPISIIGARSAGWCAAADLTLRGFDINLYEEPRFKKYLDPILLYGGIDLLAERYHNIQTHPTLWFDKKGFAEIHKVTTDIEDAVKNAELIVLFVHAYRHEDIARLLAPHLKDGQTIVISNGMAGELVFAKTLREMGVQKDILLAGVAQSLYGARRGLEYGVGENQVITTQTVLVGPKNPLAKTNVISAFPAKNTEKVIEKLRHLWKCVPGTNVLQVDLSNPNLIGHVPMCILSATWIDAMKGSFRMHLQARGSRTLAKVCDAVKKERNTIFKKMGWKDPNTEISQSPTKELPGYILHFGPIDFMHRYVHEDIQIGVRLLASLGDMINVPTPTIKSLIYICSIINEIDYFKVGRTVEKIGIDGMSIKEVNTLLATGIEST